jgi:hypothetical protein
MPTETQILTACEEAGLWPNTAASWVANGAFARYHAAINRMLAAAPAAPAPADHVTVPLAVLEDASTAIGHFVSDEGWGDEDMQAMDNLDAYIAQHKARAASKGGGKP